MGRYTDFVALNKEPQYPLQRPLPTYEQITMADSVALIVWEQYNREYPGQGFEEMRKRKGFDVLEAIYFLAKRVKDLEAEAESEDGG